MLDQKVTSFARKLNRKIILGLAVAAVGSMGYMAQATTIDWAGISSQNWTNNASWNGGTAPLNDLTSDIAHFNLSNYTSKQPVVDSPVSVNGIIIDSSSGLLNITGSGLTIGSGGITMNAGAAATTISAPITVFVHGNVAGNNSETFTNNSTNTLALGTIQTPNTYYGPTGLVIAGSGTITTTSTNINGILGNWMTFGTGAAAQYATSVGGTISGLTGTAVADVNTMTDSTANYELTNTGPNALVTSTLITSGASNTLRYSGTGSTIQIGDPTHNAVTLSTTGILNAGGGTLTIANDPANVGGLALGATGYYAPPNIFNAANGDIELSAPVVNTSASNAGITILGPNKVGFNTVTTSGGGNIVFNGFTDTDGTPDSKIMIGASHTLTFNANNGSIVVYSPIVDNQDGTPSSVVINTTGSNVVSFGVSWLDTNVSTYSGGLTVTAGSNFGITANYYGSPSSLGTGTFTINQGATIYGSNNGYYAANPNPVLLKGDFTVVAASDGLNFLPTSVVTLAPSTVGVTNINITNNSGFGGGNALVLGGITDAGQHIGLTPIGPSDIVLAGTNSFTGALTLGAPGILTTASGTSSTFAINTLIPQGTGSFTAGSPTITGLPSTAGLVVGQQVLYETSIYGDGDFLGTIVSLTANSITVSSNVSSTAAADSATAGTPGLLFGAVNGVTTLSGNSPTWAGNIVLNPAGALSLQNAGAIGVSTVTINGGVLVGTETTFDAGASFIVHNDFTLGNNGYNQDPDFSLDTWTLAPTSGSSITITLDQNPNLNSGQVYLGNIGDNGHGFGLNFAQATGITGGEVILAGTNSFTGPLTVGLGANPLPVVIDGNSPTWASNVILTSNGYLRLGSAGALGIGTLTINGGTLASSNGTVLNSAVHIIVNNSFTYFDTNNQYGDFSDGGLATTTLTQPITITMGNTAYQTQGGTLYLGPINDGGHGYGLTVTLGAGITVGGQLNLSYSDNFTGDLTITNGASVSVGSMALGRNNTVNLQGGSSLGLGWESTNVIGGLNGDATGIVNGYGYFGYLYLGGSGNYSFGGVINSGLYAGDGLYLVVAGSPQSIQSLSGANTFIGSTLLTSGTLNLDFSQPTSPTSNILYTNTGFSGGLANIVASSLALGGGTLAMTGNSLHSASQTFSNIGLGGGLYGAGRIKFTTSGQDLVLSTGNITSTSGSTLNVTLASGSAGGPASAANQTATNGVRTTTANTNGIIGGYATVTNADGSTDWATVAGGTHVAAGVYVVNTGSVGTWDDGTNNFISGSPTNIYGNVNLPQGTPISFNTITGGGSGLSAGTLYYVNQSQNVSPGVYAYEVVATPYIGPSLNTTPVGLPPANASGTLTIDTQGNIVALPSGSYTTYADVAGDTTDSNNYRIQNTGGADILSHNLTTNSFKIESTGAGTGTLTIASGKTLALTSQGLLFTGAGDYTIAGANGTIYGAGNVDIQQFGTGNLTIKSDIWGDYGGSLTKSGPGTLTLVGPKSIYGVLFINQGTINIDSLYASGNGLERGGIIFNGGTLQYASPSSASPFTGSGDITRKANTYNYGVPYVGILPGGATIDTNGNDIAYAAPLGTGTPDNEVAYSPGNLTGGLTKAGAGKLIVAATNNYAGPTTITGAGSILSVGTVISTSVTGNTTASTTLTVAATDTNGLVVGQSVTGADIPAGTYITAIVDGGTVTLNNAATGSTDPSVGEPITFGSLAVVGLQNGGVSSAIGSSAYAASNLILDSGTLQYTGLAASTDRNFTLTQNGGGLDSSGSGAVMFTNTSAIALTGSGARTLTLGGSDADANTLNLVLGDGTGGATSLTKTGAGKWVLNSVETYSGVTTMDGGTLSLSATSGIPNTTGLAVTANGGTLDINNAAGVTFSGTAGYVWGGGTLTVTSSGPALNLNNTSGTVSVVPGAAVSVSAGATLNAGGSGDPFTDTATGLNHVNVVNNSTTGFNVVLGSKSVGTITGTGNTTVSTGASLSATSIVQNTLTLNGTSTATIRESLVPNANTSVLSNLTIAGGASPMATLNLGNNSLVLRSATGDMTVPTAQIASGYAGGSWTGTGITSSTLQNDVSNGIPTGLGIATGSELLTFDGNNATFGGQTLSGTDIAVKYTWDGDTNLDGVVDLNNDFSNFVQGYSGAGTGWAFGDFNYDGVIDLNNDFSLFVQGYSEQTGALGMQELSALVSGDSALSSQTQAQMLSIIADVGSSPVPEPTSLALLGLGAVGLLTRRKRKQG